MLAAGDGSRLMRLTTALHGSPIPKQFAAFSADRRSMLQLSMDLVTRLLPDERTVVVVPASSSELAEEHLVGFPRALRVVEPKNRGTSASLLLPLAVLLERDPDADLVVVPAAQVVKDPEALLAGISDARTALDAAPVTLLGVAASSTRPDRYWIVPGRQIANGIRSIADFVAGPREPFARQLMEKHALWDTHFVVAEASTLWRVAERHLPARASVLRAAAAEHSEATLRAAYESLEPSDFAQDVLGRQLGVAVSDVTPSGFAHIATVEDVLRAFPGIRDRCAVPHDELAREAPRATSVTPARSSSAATPA